MNDWRELRALGQTLAWLQRGTRDKLLFRVVLKGEPWGVVLGLDGMVHRVEPWHAFSVDAGQNAPTTRGEPQKRP